MSDELKAAAKRYTKHLTAIKHGKEHSPYFLGDYASAITPSRCINHDVLRGDIALLADAYLREHPVFERMLEALKAFVDGAECEDAGSNEKELFAYFWRSAWLRMKKKAIAAIAEAEKVIGKGTTP